MSIDNTNNQNRGGSTGSAGATRQGTSGQAGKEVHVTRSVEVEQSDDRSLAEKAKDNPKTTAAVIGGVAAAAVGAVAAGMSSKDSDKGSDKSGSATVETTAVHEDRDVRPASTTDTNRTTTGQSGYSSNTPGSSGDNRGQTTPSQTSYDSTKNKG